MAMSFTCNRVLSHQDAADGDISGRGADTPPWLSSAIVEGRENLLSGSMRRSFGEDCDCETAYTNRVQNNRGSVEIFEERDTETVDYNMRDEKCSEDA